MVLPLKQAPQPELAVKFLGALKFWPDVLEVVGSAKKKVFVASMLYDNSLLQTKLLAARARGVTVEVLVDRVKLREKEAPQAGERLRKLKQSGAKVYLADGRPYKQVFHRKGCTGVYHAKVVVVDGEVAYNGSSNCTNSSQVNGEVVTKVTGSATAAAEAYAVAWDEAQNVGSL